MYSVGSLSTSSLSSVECSCSHSSAIMRFVLSKAMGNWLHIWGLICPESSDINLALLVLKTNGIAAAKSNVQVFFYAALQ